MDRSWSSNINKSEEDQFSSNIALLEERFPKIAFYLHAFLQDSRPGKKVKSSLKKWAPNIYSAELVYIYGLRCDFILPKNADVIFIEDDPEEILSFLHTQKAFEILSNPGVEIAFRIPKEPWDLFLQYLAEQNPVKRVECILAPHYEAKKRHFEKIRLKLLRKTTLSEGLFLDRLFSLVSFDNFLQNTKNVPHSFYVNAWKNRFQDIPAIICGAGPSLQQEIDLLKKAQNKALVLAGGSAISALTNQGIMPHLGMAVDPTFQEYRILKSNVGFEVPILYSSRVFGDIFSCMNGPMGYMRTALGQLHDLWMEEKAGLSGVFIGSSLSVEALSVTTMGLALAHFMGCNPIVFCGVDLSYTNKKRYAEGVMANSQIDLEEMDKEKKVDERLYLRKDIQGNDIYTSVKWIMESAAISDFAKRHKSRVFYNATSKGLGFKDIPFKSLGSILESLPAIHNLKDLIHVFIQNTKISFSVEDRKKYLLQLKESVKSCVSHLQVLKTEALKEVSGLSVLAEMELKEEEAYRVLFHDTLPILELFHKRKFKGEKDPEKLRKQANWKIFHQIASQFLSLMRL